MRELCERLEAKGAGGEDYKFKYVQSNLARASSFAKEAAVNFKKGDKAGFVDGVMSMSDVLSALGFTYSELKFVDPDFREIERLMGKSMRLSIDLDRKLSKGLGEGMDEAVNLKKAGVFNLTKKAVSGIDSALPLMRMVRAAMVDGIEGMPDLHPSERREILKNLDRNISQLADASDQMSMIEKSIKTGKWL